MFETLTDPAMALGADPCDRPPRQPMTVLPDDEVHVWRVNLDEAPADLLSRARTLLSDDEAARAEEFYLERHRHRFILGRSLLRCLLGWYIDHDPRQLEFCYGADGKPHLETPVSSRALFFNVTHSGALALYAVTRVGEVGIDIERVRDVSGWEQIAAACFAPFDCWRLRRLPPAARPHEFFRLWTRHEAILKAAGSGLPGRPGLKQKFSIHSLRPASDCVAALAVDGSARRIKPSAWLTKETLALFFANHPEEAL